MGLDDLGDCGVALGGAMGWGNMGGHMEAF